MRKAVVEPTIDVSSLILAACNQLSDSRKWIIKTHSTPKESFRAFKDFIINKSSTGFYKKGTIEHCVKATQGSRDATSIITIEGFVLTKLKDYCNKLKNAQRLAQSYTKENTSKCEGTTTTENNMNTLNGAADNVQLG